MEFEPRFFWIHIIIYQHNQSKLVWLFWYKLDLRRLKSPDKLKIELLQLCEHVLKYYLIPAISINNKNDNGIYF